MAASVKAWLGEGTKEEKKREEKKHLYSLNRHIMFMKHKLREISAGRQMYYRAPLPDTDTHEQFLPHLNAKNIAHFPCIYRIWHQPLALPHLFSTGHSCLVGQVGNSISIPLCLSRTNIPSILELSFCRSKADESFYSFFYCRRVEDGTQLVCHALKSSTCSTTTGQALGSIQLKQ